MERRDVCDEGVAIRRFNMAVSHRTHLIAYQYLHDEITDVVLSNARNDSVASLKNVSCSAAVNLSGPGEYTSLQKVKDKHF